VFVAENHPVWSPERQRKQRKKYGHLIKSEAFNLNDMLVKHHSQVFEKLMGETADLHSESTNIGAETPAPRIGTEAIALGTDLYTSDPMDSLAGSGQTPTIKDEHTSPHRLTPSPNPMRSPNRMPPLGTFTVTTPDRGG
jgi:histone deacetylase 6